MSPAPLITSSNFPSPCACRYIITSQRIASEIHSLIPLVVNSSLHHSARLASVFSTPISSTRVPIVPVGSLRAKVLTSFTQNYPDHNSPPTLLPRPLFAPVFIFPSSSFSSFSYSTTYITPTQ